MSLHGEQVEDIETHSWGVDNPSLPGGEVYVLKCDPSMDDSQKEELLGRNHTQLERDFGPEAVMYLGYIAEGDIDEKGIN